MGRSLRVRGGPPGRLRSGQQSARRQNLRSRKMERLCVRTRDGPARNDFVRYSRHPPFRAERFAVSQTVRMKAISNAMADTFPPRPACGERIEVRGLFAQNVK